MTVALRRVYLILRLGVAIVFFWLGADTFLHPALAPDLWMPAWLLGVFEILTGLSMATGVFLQVFSAVGAAVLIGTLATQGISTFNIQSIGLIAALAAIGLWPERLWK